MPTQDITLPKKYLLFNNCDIPAGYIRLSCYFVQRVEFEDSILWNLSGSNIVPASNSYALSVDTINELTTANGVSVDGTLLKDSGVRAGNGTAAAPTLTFASDTDTGVFRSASDTLGFSTGGTNRLTVGATGVVTNKTNVTQGTSLVTGVTASNQSGIITTVSATTAAGTSESFTLTNTFILAGSIVRAELQSYAGSQGIPIVRVTGKSTGSATITVTNLDPTDALDGVLTISFLVH